jgi:hypothetical protein
MDYSIWLEVIVILSEGYYTIPHLLRNYDPLTIIFSVVG